MTAASGGYTSRSQRLLGSFALHEDAREGCPVLQRRAHVGMAAALGAGARARTLMVGPRTRPGRESIRLRIPRRTPKPPKKIAPGAFRWVPVCRALGPKSRPRRREPPRLASEARQGLVGRVRRRSTLDEAAPYAIRDRLPGGAHLAKRVPCSSCWGTRCRCPRPRVAARPRPGHAVRPRGRRRAPRPAPHRAVRPSDRLRPEARPTDQAVRRGGRRPAATPRDGGRRRRATRRRDHRSRTTRRRPRPSSRSSSRATILVVDRR